MNQHTIGAVPMPSLATNVVHAGNAEGSTRKCHFAQQSLNACPYNMEAERLAVDDCMQGLEVRREWTEAQMVTSFGGGMIPGTPDGMFEDWVGNLRCVQVVRAPIHPAMTAKVIEEVIYQTALVKIWKSQMWMKATQILPHEFIVFLWLPFQPPEGTGEKTQALISRCKQDGWPFCFRCKIPADPESIFPLKFAWQKAGREGAVEGVCTRRVGKNISETDLSTFDPTDFESNSGDEEEILFPDLFEEEEEEEWPSICSCVAADEHAA